MRFAFIFSLLIMFGFEVLVCCTKGNPVAKGVCVGLIAFVCITLTVMGVALW